MKKRIFSILLALFMVAAMIPTAALASNDIVASGNCGMVDGKYGEVSENVKWFLDSEGTLTIRGTGDMADFATIDDSDGMSPWGQNIKAVVIENGVTSIGMGAFYKCKQLASAKVPSSVTWIRISAFAYCEGLKSIVLPEGVETIGSGVFGRCIALESIYLPKTLNGVGVFTFSHCDSLNDVYYAGNEADWKLVDIDSSSDLPASVTMHYNYSVPTSTGFTDVAPGSYCYDAVQWAVANGITKGTDTTHFSPNVGCTRGQVVTFLWRAAGEPTVSGNVGFVDVAPGSYCYEAVKWAVANGITKGTDATHFSPNATCTRGQVVTFMYRAAGEPAVGGSSGFVDVATGSYCCNAVQWAVANGITKGTDTTHFSPNATCTRGQVVTFLYRAQ